MPNAEAYCPKCGVSIEDNFLGQVKDEDERDLDVYECIECGEPYSEFQVQWVEEGDRPPTISDDDGENDTEEVDDGLSEAAIAEISIASLRPEIDPDSGTSTDD